MRKIWLPILLLAAVALAACAPAAPPQAPTATAAPTQPAAPPATAEGAMQCRLESILPTPDPAQAARFAPVTEKDWIQGRADAKVTLLEYSDFM